MDIDNHLILNKIVKNSDRNLRKAILLLQVCYV